MSRRATLRMVAGSLAAGSAVAATPIRHNYIDDLAGFVPGRTDPVSAAANSAAVDAAFASGLRALHIRPGTSFAIARSLVLPSGGTLVGHGKGQQRPTIVMPAACFTNDRGDAGSRYGPTAAGIVVATDNRAAQAAQGVRIVNIALRSERRDGRVLRGIVARNVVDLELADVDISGLPVGVAFCLASIRGSSRIERCRAHDCRSDRDWGAQHPQITGLEIDNDRIDDVATTGLVVDGFRAEDLTVGPAFLAAHGYETDGVNICAPEATGNLFRDILVRNVGEGIDTFGCDSRFEKVVAQNCHIYGIKCVHGASRNVFDRPIIRNAGLAGITVSGSNERVSSPHRVVRVDS
ncbi:hypothetical protein [Sphingomonas sp.]|uniref:hypothetical protein n=1 Tax=Sphingomonas sp. TaxID=28214 RepID=UPI0025FFE2E1|nr:hypothetical protein [Sphingomonas sp.]